MAIFEEVMFLIARKNLFADKIRLLIPVSGVALAVLLIITLWGLYLNWENNFGAFLSSIPADLWISRAGARSISHTFSLLPEEMKSKIEEIEGVNEVNKFLGGLIFFKMEGKDKELYLVGFDTEKMIGKPLKIVKGKGIPDENEIIIDRVFAQKNDLEIGDFIPIRDRRFKVVGISNRGNMLIYQYAFVRQPEFQELLNILNFTNFFLAKIDKEANLQRIKEKLEETIPQIDVFTREEFVEANTRVISESYLPILYVLSLIGMLVGAIIIGVTIYTITIERSREFGILKAIGMENSTLYQVVFFQSLIPAIFGFILGVGLTYLVNFIANLFVPDFSASIEIFNLALAFSAAILMAVLASWIPLRRIAKADPASVFRA